MALTEWVVVDSICLPPSVFLFSASVFVSQLSLIISSPPYDLQESRGLNGRDGFEDECLEKYDQDMFERFCEVFAALPLGRILLLLLVVCPALINMALQITMGISIVLV